MNDMVDKSKAGLVLRGHFPSSSCSPASLGESTDTKTVIGRMGFFGTPAKGVEAICRWYGATGPSWSMRRLAELFIFSSY
jgi:hypothetical protein